MLDGGILEEYLNRVRDLKNRLATLGEPMFDCTLVQDVLDGLLRSYENIIPTITYSAMFPTFHKMSAMLLIVHHRLQHQNLHLDDEEALPVQFCRGAKITLR